jgi:hypothetical protein
MRTFRLAFTLIVLLVLPAAAAEARDRDRDKLPDRWEQKHHFSTKKKSGGKDPDRDGLSNLGEYRSKTNPRRKDSDRDAVVDGDEDPDRDRVDNDNEMREGTKPRDRDSDDDRRSDGREDRDRDGLLNAAEDLTGNDPKDRDSDNDGTGDGAEQAGVVTSFTAARLTIDLANGTSVSGLVLPTTDVECETEDELESFQRGRVSASRAVARSAQGEAEDPEEPPIGDPEPGGDNEDDPVDEGDDAYAEDDRLFEQLFGAACDSGDLAPGVRIHEAELKSVAGLAGVFTEIELLK